MLVGGYYFYREINKMKDKFSNLERLSYNIKMMKKKKKNHSQIKHFIQVETNNAILKMEINLPMMKMKIRIQKIII